MKKLLLITLAVSLLSQANSQELKKDVNYQVTTIGFYNVENLFDTLDTEGKNDAEFLPNGKNRWNTEKYDIKLENLSRVIADIGTEYNPDGVAVLGISEIENAQVVEDLVATDRLKDRNYQVVHHDGPDRRGIDVGLIYNPSYFTLESTKSFVVDYPADTSFRTRSQLLVTGELKGEKIHIIVVHWPSRSGGQKRSEPKRLGAAMCGKAIVDSLIADDPDARIMYMGDFNDDPGNKSVSKIMEASSKKPKSGDTEMFNPMTQLFKQGVGSLAWRDTWNLFDQIIMSAGWVDDDLTNWSYFKTRIFNEPYLINSSGNWKGYPYRTFAGGAWAGGYSDHFPVFTVLVKEVSND